MKKYRASLQSAAGTFALSLMFCGASVHAQENQKTQNIDKGSPTTSIVGGSPVAPGELTYQVSLGSGGCGGTIIADQWILTAAHCISSNWPSSVRVGVNRLSSNEGETHNVVQRITHENYVSVRGGYDIALLKVDGTINSNYTRAKLPTAAVMQAIGSPGDMLDVSGWGRLSSGGTSPDVLHEVSVPVVSNTTCNNPASYNGDINATMLCAGYAQGGKDACQGDSGGPIVGSYQNEVYSIGVVSWGEGCASPDKYGVYARTSYFVDWINNKIGGTPPPGPVKLENKVAVSVSGSQSEEKHYYLDIPAGSAASNLSFSINGGTGDADLYVKFGAAPSVNSYDCRPYKTGNTETCDIAAVQTGRYHVMLRGYTNFSGTQLLASYDTTSSPEGKLTNGSVETVSGNQNDQKYFYMDVPAGVSSLSFEISGGTGDADLYTRFGADPSLSQYDCRPYRTGNNETCTVSNVQQGRYHLMLHGYTAFSNVSLVGRH